MIDHTRHSGIFNVDDQSITLIGAGGIGAITALTLGKMGVAQLHVWDDDVVSPENTATQFFSSFDVERAKVQVLSDYMLQFAEDTEYQPHHGRVDCFTDWQLLANPILISAVDSIKTRQAIWEAIKDKPWIWYLETRMGAETFQIYTVQRQSRYWYEDTLLAQDESQVPDLPCTSKATIFTGMIAAGHIGKTVRMIATGITPPKLVIHDIINDVITKIG